MNNQQERAWVTLLSRLHEARHPACGRLRQARLLPSDNGAFRVALASADDLNALSGLEDSMAAVLEAIVHHPVCVTFHALDRTGDRSPNGSHDTGTPTPDTAGSTPETPASQTNSIESRPSALDAAHATGAAGVERPGSPGGGAVFFDPLLRRKRVCAIAARSPAALKVLAYLETCVCTRDGWTWGLSQRRLSDELGSRHHRVGEALDLLADAGILIDRRRDERNGYLTRFRLDGYSYVSGEIGTARVPEWYRQGTNLVSVPEIGTAVVPHMNLVDVVDLLRRLSPETLIEILRTLEGQQQDSQVAPPGCQSPGLVPPGYQSAEIGTARVPISGTGAESGPARSVPPGCQSAEFGTATVPNSGRSLPRLDPAALDPDRRLAYHWLAGYRIVGATLLELLGFRVEEGALVDTGDAPDPERVIGLLLEIERDRRDGRLEDAHATGRLVTHLRGDAAQPWARTRRFVRHVRQNSEAPMVGQIDLLAPDFAVLLDAMLHGLHWFSDPAHYTDGEYADFIES